jgi:hypothetical protein
MDFRLLWEQARQDVWRWLAPCDAVKDKVRLSLLSKERPVLDAWNSSIFGPPLFL